MPRQETQSHRELMRPLEFFNLCMCIYIYIYIYIIYIYIFVFFLRITNDRKTKLAAKTELSFANSQLDLLKEELEGINSTLDVYQFDR